MANPTAFYLLLAYIISAHLLSSGGYFRSWDTFSTSRSKPILMRTGCSILSNTCWHTPNHTTASTDQLYQFHKHVHFKSSPSLPASMPIAAFLELPPTAAMAKSRNLPASGLSTITSVTSFSMERGNVLPHDNYALLAKLQDLPIHAPPGTWPIRAGAHLITKMQPIERPLRMQRQKQPRTKNLLPWLLGLKPWGKSRRSRKSWSPLPKLRPQRWLPKPKNYASSLQKLPKQLYLLPDVPQSRLLPKFPFP